MMVIDAFVFNDDNTARKISINAVRGAFRFITGNSPKDAYSITTPTATIGVRGTEFDFNVDPRDGTTRVVQFEGKTRGICNRRPEKRPAALVNWQRICVEVAENCGPSPSFRRRGHPACSCAAADPQPRPERVLPFVPEPGKPDAGIPG